jgi:ComEC/Rec2-related protein
VIGDDRAQPADATDDFRAAGLTHLLAVSGQNVAFALALASPALSRLRFGSRFAATLAVLGFFALVTRFEPSVLRATAVAAIAALAFSAGRTTTRLRVLALAVTALLLVDPLLVRSVGFGLSTAASASILVLAPRIAAALPRPRALANALAVTLAAQLGVAPLLLTTFGPVPLASIPANLLAVPAAGPLMMWGLSAGMVAGLTGGVIARVLHWPSAALLAWIDGVATRSALLPVGELDWSGFVAAAGGIVLLLVAVRLRARLLRVAALATLALALGASVVGAPRSPHTHGVLGAGAELWSSAGATIVAVDGRADAERLLEALRRSGVRRIDVVLVRGPGTSAQLHGTVAALARRYRGVTVLAPAGSGVEGSRVPVAPTSFAVGSLVVTVDRAVPSLRVRVAAGTPLGRR